MDFKVVVDWKFVVALGGAVTGLIFAVKLDPAGVKEVSIHAVDAFKRVALAVRAVEVEIVHRGGEVVHLFRGELFLEAFFHLGAPFFR